MCKLAIVSEYPPPFSQTPPVRKKSNTLIWMIVGACILLPCIVCGVGGGWFWSLFKNSIAPIATCSIAFESVRDGVKDYAHDHDGKLPNAETWQDDVKSYYAKSAASMKDQSGPFPIMDANGEWGCKQDDGTMTGMSFNEALSGKKLEDIKEPSSTVMIFESPKAQRNAHSKYTELTKSTSPMMMGKHRGWFYIHVEGSLESTGGGRVRFNQGGSGSSGF